ncbi:hypothetical protein LAZ67_8003305 [Cordylochernes scorpioides]|uniref:Transposase n=1 Tax=Cordylochernes scorpioides TaxID=51811 RepID=A0ABY6KRH5_9ARAC|nr:hypothetical protein LAZ67_8003305 [Cordylochernes scorpioides]
MSKSRIKTMIIVFFDIRGIVHCEFVPQGQTVNSAFYLEVLRRLKRRIPRVRTDIKDTVKLHHDNATSHIAFIITNFLARSNTPVIPHPPYSPDLAPWMSTTTILTGHGNVLADLALWLRDLDPTCPHCREESQTVDHLLFSCPAFMLHRLQTALLLGVQDFSPTALPLLPDSLPAWNYLVTWFTSAICSPSHD